MKQFKNIESVGWIFWIICSLLLLVPNYFLAGFLVYDYSKGTRIGFTIGMSAVVGAIIAWVVNEILYRINLAKYKETRKKERKKKRKNS
ncbi:MAG TPA: hypothetical protein PLT82_10315 [Candidatus Hydrogenedens sp.]|nr:hypothetical protein [Candidatus Hydrogenedens sp.]HOL19776.1 hypothetical protein [Candidatus Hydrogenedens sp.]HPP59515.1 hypothetical protein [Candidatus Hydrogenedens sp.]